MQELDDLNKLAKMIASLTSDGHGFSLSEYANELQQFAKQLYVTEFAYLYWHNYQDQLLCRTSWPQQHSVSLNP